MGDIFQKNSDLFSADAALVERLESGHTKDDIYDNLALGLPEALGPNAAPHNLPIDKPLAVVCAAGDIAGERMEALNHEASNYFVVLGGAGAYSQPSDDVLAAGNLDTSKYLDPSLTHAAITNFSNFNSHTKPFGLLKDQVVFVASHCASVPVAKNDQGDTNPPTIQTLLAGGRVKPENMRLFQVHLDGVDVPEALPKINTGTGAPPAAIALTLALREQAGITTPLEVKLFGMDGTSVLLGPTSAEKYDKRFQKDQILVRLGGENGQVFVGQSTFLRQTMELITLAYEYGIKISVDNDSSINGQIFNFTDKPRTDIEVCIDGQNWVALYKDDAPSVSHHLQP